MQRLVLLGSLAFSVVLVATPSLARTWYITPDGTGDAPTVQAGIDSAAVGDVVELACGTYYETDVRLVSGIVLRSSTGESDCATIRGPEKRTLLRLESISDTRIEGVTLMRGDQGIFADESSAEFVRCKIYQNISPGGATVTGSSSLSFLECRFEGNAAGTPHGGGSYGGAAYCFGTGTTARFEGCEFLNNAASFDGYGGAVFVSDGAVATFVDCHFEGNQTGNSTAGGAIAATYATITVENCGFLRNFTFESPGNAIFAYESAARLSGCTFHDNGIWNESDVVFWDCAVPVTIEACSFSGGDRVSTDAPDAIDITCTNIQGDWGVLADRLGVDGNISADPLHCGPETGDLTLDASSPCLPPNNECGVLMGAYGQGCGTVSLTPRTWSAIKASYLRSGSRAP